MFPHSTKEIRMTSIAAIPATAPPLRPDAVRATAQEMETAFLAEMLSHAGLGPQEGSFGGGQGEEQFASFLRQEQARLMVEAGGIGLSEAIFRAMTAQGDSHAPAT
jgi:Rod binding domain-containing protein